MYSFAHDILSPTVRLSNCSKNIIVDEESFRQKKSDISCNSSSTPCLPVNVSPAQKVERWLEKTAFENAVIFYFFTMLIVKFCCFMHDLYITLKKKHILLIIIHLI